MPHAEEYSSLNGKMVNGEAPQSKFIDHLTSYPVVSDGINAVKEHPVGAKSIEIVDDAYARFAKPVLPYLATPYSFAQPYVEKADSLADSGLDKIETQFPIVKKDSQTVHDTARTFWPFKVLEDTSLYALHTAENTARYALDTWSDEYRKTKTYKNRGDGLTTLIMSVISFDIKVMSDILAFVINQTESQKEKARDQNGDITGRAQKQLDGAVDQGKRMTDDAASKFQQKSQQGQQAFDQGKQTANSYAAKAQEKTQQRTN